MSHIQRSNNLSLSELDPWAFEVVENLTTENMRGGSRQNECKDHSAALLELAKNEITGTARRSVDYYELQKLYITNPQGTVWFAKPDVFTIKRDGTIFMKSPSFKKHLHRCHV